MDKVQQLQRWQEQHQERQQAEGQNQQQVRQQDRQRGQERDGKYHLRKKYGAAYLTFPALEKYDELTHLFTTRIGGVSEGSLASWNLGSWSSDTKENIRKNYEILSQVMEVPLERMVRSSQTHTTNIRRVTAEDGGKGILRERDYMDIDGLITDVRGLALVTSHGDCNAVFFFDPVRQAIGLAHSGWRGTLGNISGDMIGELRDGYGSEPQDIVVGIGPALCQECFEVDEDVARAFFGRDEAYREFAVKRGVKHYIDLKEIIRYQLMQAGIEPSHIYDMGLCTRCRPDWFFSYRGQKGKNGIMAAAMMLK